LTLRLIDMHCNWLWQYACESTHFEPSCYGEVPGRLSQLDGYMLGCAAAVLACGRRRDDWANQGDPWRALLDLLARYESEFTGRLLIADADVARFVVEPESGLCWGMLGVSGFDSLIRKPVDLDHLPGLFQRGARVFGLVQGRETVLGGSADPGDDRGLTDLGRAFLSRLAEVTSGGPGPRPIVDLAHLNPRSMAEVIAFANKCAGAGRLLLMYSHGCLSHPHTNAPHALSHDNLVQLRAAGGVIGFTAGPPYHDTPEELRAGIETAASVPFEGRAGYEGIAVGTDFLGINQTIPGLGNVLRLKNWLHRTFEVTSAVDLIAGNGRRLLTRAAGCEDVPPASLS
jgi:membrane dipeptidase